MILKIKGTVTGDLHLLRKVTHPETGNLRMHRIPGDWEEEVPCIITFEFRELSDCFPELSSIYEVTKIELEEK